MATPWPNTLVFKRNLRRALAVALVSFGALVFSALVAADAAEPREETAFGSNPGNLRMFSYVAAELAPTAPLIVVLHGCKQKAAAFARDAGWLALADRAKLALLLPEQKGLPSYFYESPRSHVVATMFGANNQNACFNWFEPKDTVRDRGEALSIRQMIDAMLERYSLDRSRVYCRWSLGRRGDGGSHACALSGAFRRRRHRGGHTLWLRQRCIQGVAMHEPGYRSDAR